MREFRLNMMIEGVTGAEMYVILLGTTPYYGKSAVIS